MLSSGCLLRNICIFERVGAFSKCTSNGKSNVIKSLNAENKYLYGNLLETQKQRRKTISKTEGVSTDEKEKSVIEDCSEAVPKSVQHETAIKKTSQRTRKSKAIQNFAKSSANFLHTDVLVSDNSLSAVATNNLESKTLNQETSEKKTKKLKVSKSSTSVNSPPPVVDIADSKTPESLDQFVFKASVTINETNYPLENPEKQSTVGSSVGNVLSYGFNDPEIKNYMKLPSVSKIMEETMSAKSKLILNKWRQNMISDMGEDGFYNYNKALKARGQEFHSAVRNTVQGKSTDDCSEITQKALKSLSWMLEHTTHPMAVESITAHPSLGYKGIPDCVALFRNIPVVMDWKLSDKPKKDLKDTYEAPVQITAYIGALNHDPNYKWGVNHGLVAVAYANGDPCDVFLLAPKHCHIYWRHWLMRFDKFNARSHLHVDHEIDEKSLERV